MAAEMKVTDSALQAAMDAYAAKNEEIGDPVEYFPDAMEAALQAALAAMLDPVGKLPDHAMQRLKTIGFVGWDDLFTLESEVPDAHIAYVIKEPK